MSIPQRKTSNDAMESAFFRDVDSLIVHRLHNEADADGARGTLMKGTGLHDEKLIDELTQLGVTSESLVAMRVVPLVLVAWAHNGVDEAERETVMKQAIKSGVKKGSVAAMLLEHWLHHKPPTMIIDAWKRYMRNEFTRVSTTGKEKLITLMEQQMTAVAKASGGCFGFGKIAAKERHTIEMMTHVLRD